MHKVSFIAATILTFFLFFCIDISICLAEEKKKTIIKAVTTCNEYGQSVSVILKNVAGKKIAERKTQYKGSFVVAEKLIDLSSGKVIKEWTFDAKGRRMQDLMFLCLDKDGKIVKDNNGNPNLIKIFKVRQREETSIRYSDYNPFIKSGGDTTIFPCENCIEQTNGSCIYVW